VFERFTDEARAVVVTAHEEARAAQADRVEPAHLLLGVRLSGGPGAAVLAAAGIDGDRLRAAVRAAGADDGLDADALAAVGIDLGQVRDAVESLFGAGALGRRRRRAGRARFAASSKRCLEQTLRAALRRGHRRIDTADVLAGVLATADPAVGAVLRDLGADPAELRRAAEGGAAAA
jgi:ATP-dependent Clp protease ATP-binding subunit ClpA